MERPPRLCPGRRLCRRDEPGRSRQGRRRHNPRCQRESIAPTRTRNTTHLQPFTYNTTNNERELILPAINGVRALLSAAAKNPHLHRIVLTSSFAAVIDTTLSPPPTFTYTASHWNPLTYATSIAPTTPAIIAYRGSKKFAELEAWHHLSTHPDSPYTLTTLCPPMVFGPVAHPAVPSPAHLNESNAQLWAAVATPTVPLPEARVPFWIDVRDLAQAHVAALVSEQAAGKRYTVASPERFSYGLAARIVRERFPHRRVRGEEEGGLPEVGWGLDGETAARELGVGYRGFGETVGDLVGQMEGLERA